ncbi:sodium:calcium antiporter [Haladaptatus sp. NG-SE-30]
MFEETSLFVLVVIFAVAATVVYVAGVYVSNMTDVLSVRLGLGQALSGVILLAIVTNLPEFVITTSAALTNNLDIAIGNILGGIAIQTVVLVLFDAFGVGQSDGLTYWASSIQLVLEASIVVAVLSVTVMGSQLVPALLLFRLTPPEVVIGLLWMGGIWVIVKARSGLPWVEQDAAPGGQQVPLGTAKKKKHQQLKEKGKTTQYIVVIFFLAAIATLVGGVLLERTSGMIANRLNISGAIFGATVLASITSLPEVSTGMAAIKLGDYELAISDIFGGNGFLPTLFILASILSGKSVLANMVSSTIYLTALGILLTTIYIIGLLVRPRRQILRMGIDSFLVLILYCLGIVGLVAINY